MTKKGLGAERIVTELRQDEFLQGRVKSIALACKDVGTTEQSHYRWRKEYIGLGCARHTCSNVTPLDERSCMQ